MKKTAMLIGLAAVLGFSSNAQAVDWNWKGDLRYRYESEYTDNNAADIEHSTDRHRMRVRLGADMWINEELSAGFELRTGDLGATSGNVDLSDTDDKFESWAVGLSEAYIDFHPMALGGDVNILMGKRYNKETLAVMDDLIWDGDVTLEGITVSYGKDAKGKEKDGLEVAAGYYVYEETADDSYIVAGQISYKGEASDLKYQIGSSYYDYAKFNGANTHDYNIVELFGNVGGKVSSLPWKTYVQYAFNTAKESEFSGITDGERAAYLVGVKLGAAKKPGQLEGSLEYYRIEEDAVNPAMTDSDRKAGLAFTNIKGWKASAKYALIQNMTLGVNYFYSSYINDSTPTHLDNGQLLQLDAVVKF